MGMQGASHVYRCRSISGLRASATACSHEAPAASASGSTAQSNHYTFVNRILASYLWCQSSLQQTGTTARGPALMQLTPNPHLRVCSFHWAGTRKAHTVVAHSPRWLGTRQQPWACQRHAQAYTHSGEPPTAHDQPWMGRCLQQC